MNEDDLLIVGSYGGFLREYSLTGSWSLDLLSSTLKFIFWLAGAREELYMHVAAIAESLQDTSFVR